MRALALAFSIVATTLLTSASAHATEKAIDFKRQCALMMEAARRNEIHVEPFHTGLSKRQLRDSLLRQTLVLADVLTERMAQKASYTDLAKEFDPIFSTIVIAGTRYQAVNVALGENPYVYLFTYDTAAFSGISSLDGSVKVGDDWCDVELETTPF